MDRLEWAAAVERAVDNPTELARLDADVKGTNDLTDWEKGVLRGRIGSYLAAGDEAVEIAEDTRPTYEGDEG